MRPTTGAVLTKELLPVPLTVDAPAQRAPPHRLREEAAGGTFTDAPSTAAGEIDLILEKDGGRKVCSTTVVQVDKEECDEEQDCAEHRLMHEHAQATRRCQYRL